MRKPLLEVWNNNSFTKSYGSPVYCDDPQSYSTGNIVALYVFLFYILLVIALYLIWVNENISTIIFKWTASEGPLA